MKFYKRITKWMARCYKLMFASSKLSILVVSKPIKPTTPSASSASSAWNERAKSTLENPNRKPFQKFQEHDSCSVFPKNPLKKIVRNPKISWEPSFSGKKMQKKITRSHSDLQLSSRSTVLQHLGRLQVYVNPGDGSDWKWPMYTQFMAIDDDWWLFGLFYDCSIQMEIHDDWWRLMVILQRLFILKQTPNGFAPGECMASPVASHRPDPTGLHIRS